MLFKASTVTLFWKCLSAHGGRQALTTGSMISNPGSGFNNSAAFKNAASQPMPTSWCTTLLAARNFMTGHEDDSATKSAGNSVEEKYGIPAPPKRTPNMFAIFCKESFARNKELPLKERFVKASEEWHALSETERDVYKRQMTEGLIVYKKEMANYLESLPPDGLEMFKKLKREKVKDRTKTRLKIKLRKLNYPKRPKSAYIFFTRDQMQKQYPDGNIPSVKTPEHIRSVGIWAQRWRAMNSTERHPFEEKAEADRKRYFEEMEQWKANLARPENEDDLRELERMSRKIENTKLSENTVKRRQARVAAKIIKRRVEKKAKEAIKVKTALKKANTAAKKLAAAAKKSSTPKKKSSTSKKPKKSDTETQEEHEE